MFIVLPIIIFLVIIVLLIFFVMLGGAEADTRLARAGV